MLQALVKLHELKCRHLVALVPNAYHEHDGAGYIVMELAGPNMADSQPNNPSIRWDPVTILQAGADCFGPRRLPVTCPAEPQAECLCF